MEKQEIINKIKELKSEMEKLDLSTAKTEQLTKYLMEVDRLTAMLITASETKEDKENIEEIKNMFSQRKE